MLNRTVLKPSLCIIFARVIFLRILKSYFLKLLRHFIDKFKQSISSYFFLTLSFIFLFFYSFQNLYSQDDTAVKEGKKLFNANCAACHKLKKRSIGPALKGVTEKYDREWLYSWIKNGSAMIKAGDPQAVAIYEEYNKSVMNNFPQFSTSDIDKILAYTNYTPPLSTAPVASSIAVNNAQGNDFSNNFVI